MSEIQLRNVYSQISQEIHGSGLNFLTAEEFFTQWLENKQIERRTASFEKYSGVIGRFLKFLGNKASKDIMTITSADVTSYRNEIAQRLKSSTANGHLKILRVAFEDAVRESRILHNPAKQVRTIQKGAGSARRAFTIEEIEKLLSAAQGEWKGLVLMGLCTGQRLGDIARLKWTNVDLERRIISLVTRKTGKSLDVWIVGILWEYLSKQKLPEDKNMPVFPAACAAVEKAESVHTLSKEFHDLLVRVGLAKPWICKRTGTGRSVSRDNTGLSFHAFRHTTTSFLKKCGVPEAVAMAIIGHRSRAISEIYTHMDVETISHWMKSADAKVFSDLHVPAEEQKRCLKIGNTRVLLSATSPLGKLIQES